MTSFRTVRILSNDKYTKTSRLTVDINAEDIEFQLILNNDSSQNYRFLNFVFK
jgi:hypothetical protein